MKKINAFILIVLAAATSACYKSGSTEKPKTAPATANASPVAGVADAPDNSNEKPSISGSAAEKEIAELEKTVQKDPKNSRAHYQLGVNYQALKNEDKAIDAYKKAIDAKADYAEANYELGKIYIAKKDHRTALPFMQKAAKVNYKSPEYLVALGDTYRELNECNLAMPPYGNSVNFDDKNPAAYYGMGLCYLELKNKLAAQAQLRPLEKLDKNLAKKLEDKIAGK